MEILSLEHDFLNFTANYPFDESAVVELNAEYLTAKENYERLKLLTQQKQNEYYACRDSYSIRKWKCNPLGQERDQLALQRDDAEAEMKTAKSFLEEAKQLNQDYYQNVVLPAEEQERQGIITNAQAEAISGESRAALKDENNETLKIVAIPLTILGGGILIKRLFF